MRKLHVVGLTADLDGVIFSTRKGSKSGSFVAPIGDELLRAIADAERMRNGADIAPVEPFSSRAPRPQSALTPREIQSRLRAGRTIAEVAREANVDTAWVERFAAPILAEQAKVVDLARTLTFSKPRRGESSEPLGASVGTNLSLRGVQMLEDEFNASWSAYQMHDKVWMVRFAYRSRGRSQQATWELDMAEGSLHARDRLASDLGYLEAGYRGRAGRLDEAAPHDEPEAPQPAPPPVRRQAPSSGARPAPAPPAARSGAKATAKRVRTPPKRAAKAPAPARAAAASKRRPPARSTPKKVAGTTKRAPAKALAKVATKAATKAAPARKAPAARTGNAAAGASASPRPKATATRKSPGAKKTAARTARKASPAKRAPSPPRATHPTPPPEPPAAPPATARSSGPRFGTDGTRLGPAGSAGSAGSTRSGGMAGRRPPAASPAPPRPAPTSATGTNGRSMSAGRPPAAGPPPGGRWWSEPRSRSTPSREGSERPERPARPAASPASPASPASSPASPAPPERSAPPAGSAERRLGVLDERLAAARADAGRRSPPPRRDTGEDDVDDDDEFRPPRRGERRPATRIGPPPETASNEDEGTSEDDGAFVIRPRISAKQASELTLDEERSPKLRSPFARITTLPPIAPASP